MNLPPGLTLVTDRIRARRPLIEICGIALRAGFAAIMLREKDLEARNLMELAGPLHQTCKSLGKTFLINSRLDVVLALPGAGAHIGLRGVPVADARRLLGPGRILGYSAHEIGEAKTALADGADVTLSPIFPSLSKPGLNPRGLPFLGEGAALLSPRPVIALGGLNAERLAQVRACGAHGAAVMGAVMQAEDPERAAGELVSAWEKAGSGTRTNPLP